MSHYTVMVRIPEGEGIDAMREMLAPFEECTDVAEYNEWDDETEQLKKDYETDLADCFKLADGTIKSKYSDEFATYKGDGFFRERVYVMPEGATEIEVQVSELYNFHDYCTDYCGHMEHPTKPGLYGCMRNPNAKWDWYQIGGRWSNMLLTKNNRMTDACMLSDLHWDEIDRQTETKLFQRWEEYQDALKGEGDNCYFTGHRRTLFALGLLKAVSVDEPAPEGEGWEPYKFERKNGDNFKDYIKRIDRDEFDKFRDHFCTIRTYCRLDSDGWVAPGEMGWFGMSDDTPDTMIEYSNDFVNWLKSGNQSDIIVVVDCHI